MYSDRISKPPLRTHALSYFRAYFFVILHFISLKRDLDCVGSHGLQRSTPSVRATQSLLSKQEYVLSLSLIHAVGRENKCSVGPILLNTPKPDLSRHGLSELGKYCTGRTYPARDTATKYLYMEV
jgi:hypothetical protein